MTELARRASRPALTLLVLAVATGAASAPLRVLPSRLPAMPAETWAGAREAAETWLDARCRVIVAPLVPESTELDRPHVKRAIAAWTLRYPQLRAGLRIQDAALVVSLKETGGGLEARIVSDSLVRVPAGVVPGSVVSADDAARIAAEALRTFKPLPPSLLTGTMPASLELDATGTVPAWVVIARGLDPAVDLRVVVSALDGRILDARDLVLRVTGMGRVFDPNPVIMLNDATLTDMADSAAAVPMPAYSIKPLLDLDPPVGGMHLLKGPYVFVDDFRAPNDVPASEADPNAFTYLRDDDRFEQVVVYETLDALQRWIQSLGFTDILNRQLRADAHALNADNSYFSPADFTLNFGDGGVDDGEDGDIVTHEAGHALHADVNPGYGGTNEAGALGEAMGDYLAGTRHERFGVYPECVGAWDATSYSGSTPPCLRRLDSTKHYPEDMVGEVHADGEIWSAAMWQIRQRRGADTTDTILLQSQFLTGTRPSFRDAALALLQADADLGTGAKDDICQVMIARGILQLADCPADLAVASVAVDDAVGGDGDGWLEPGESADLVVRLVSSADVTQALVAATLRPRDAVVTMLRATAAYPDLAPRASADPAGPRHRIEIDAGAACGAELVFDADLSSDRYTGTDSFTLVLGEPVPLGPTTGAYAGAPVAIPDNNPAGMASPIGLIASGTVGAVTAVSVDIAHSFRGDLRVELVSPMGTVVRLHDRGGGAARDLVTTYPAPTAPSGPGALSDFAGERILGDWTLRVFDLERADTGELRGWSLTIDGVDIRCGSGGTCPGVEIATGIDGLLRVAKAGAGAVSLAFPGPTSTCALGVEVRRSSTPRPLAGSGTFPTDPSFADITSQDTDPGAPFRHVPPAGNSYYLVVEDLPPGGVPGPSGSYGY